MIYKCCIMISNIKQKRNIEIPLLLPGVRPVSNLFKFKKKWVMGKAHLVVTESFPIHVPLMRLALLTSQHALVGTRN